MIFKYKQKSDVWFRNGFSIEFLETDVFKLVVNVFSLLKAVVDFTQPRMYYHCALPPVLIGWLPPFDILPNYYIYKSLRRQCLNTILVVFHWVLKCLNYSYLVEYRYSEGIK